MTQEHFEHVTVSGERWDLIAYQYYGDATLIKHLLLANPDVLASSNQAAPLVFEAGQKIRVPVLPEDTIKAPQLPPWKR